MNCYDEAVEKGFDVGEALFTQHFFFTDSNQLYNQECQNLYGKIRKISVTCQLSDNSEYKGGELEFDFRNNVPNNKDFNNFFKTTDKMTSKGSIIVFPSFVWHRVKPVTKGVRDSLVMWNLGYPFK